MGKLKTLGTRLSTAPSRLTVLTSKPGVEERIRGRAGTALREAALQASQYLCVRCRDNGVIRAAAVVDHRVPLHLGGRNDLSNMDGLCVECHLLKSKAEAANRGQRGL